PGAQDQAIVARWLDRGADLGEAIEKLACRCHDRTTSSPAGTSGRSSASPLFSGSGLLNGSPVSPVSPACPFWPSAPTDFGEIREMRDMASAAAWSVLGFPPSLAVRTCIR